MASQKTLFKLWKFFVGIPNPLLKWLLRSPLHGLMSHSYLLISVIGRKSGKTITTPVLYKQQGQQITIISHKNYQWWRNLRGGAKLNLVLRGKKLEAEGVVAEKSEAVATAYGIMYPKLGVEVREKMASQSVAVSVELV